MITTRISPARVNQIRRFTVDVLKPIKAGSKYEAALSLFNRYKGSEIPERAGEYVKNLNGGCPKTKERILLAVKEFRGMSGYVENVLLSTNKNNDACAEDFLPPNTLGGRTTVSLQ